MNRKRIVTLTLSVAKGKRLMPAFRPLALLGVTAKQFRRRQGYNR